MNKPFDLAAVLKGEPVIVENFRFIFSELETYHGEKCLLMKTKEDGVPLRVRFDGSIPFAVGAVAYMAPRKVKKTVWVNINEKPGYGSPYYSAAVYKEKAAADWSSPGPSEKRVSTAIPVEIEVEE